MQGVEGGQFILRGWFVFENLRTNILGAKLGVPNTKSLFVDVAAS